MKCCFICRCSLQQRQCVVMSSSDIKPGSDPIFDDVSRNLTGKVNDVTQSRVFLK